jgi:C4-dicarboxylate-specific signal transduction histidine kinase
MLDHPTEAPTPNGPDHDAEQARLVIAGRLVRAVAHNLRQPLMALEMNLATILRLTKQGPLDVELVRDAIEDARLAERRMAVSLQALEDLATPRRRRHEPIDIAIIVRETAQLVATNAKPSPVRIEAEIEADLPALVGDEAMVREAVLSLVLSAVDRVLDTAPRRGRRPAVLAIARRDGGAHVAVVVEHSGQTSHGDRSKGSSWDTSIAQVALTLHGGSLALERDGAASRAIMRWPIRGD